MEVYSSLNTVAGWSLMNDGTSGTSDRSHIHLAISGATGKMASFSVYFHSSPFSSSSSSFTFHFVAFLSPAIPSASAHPAPRAFVGILIADK